MPVVAVVVRGVGAGGAVRNGGEVLLFGWVGSHGHFGVALGVVG